MMRGFYRVRVNVFAGDAPETPTPASFGCVTLCRVQQFYYLHSASNPNPALEEAGGELLADNWTDLRTALSAEANDLVFRKLVRRTVEGEEVTLQVTRDDTDPSDVLELDWMPPHKFSGDPEPEPL